MITEPTADTNETATDGAGDANVDDPMSSRRRMLRTLALGAAGAAAAGAAVAIGNAGTAAAADGDPLPSVTTNTHTLADERQLQRRRRQAASFNIQSGDQTAANDGILNGLFANAGTTLLGVASGNGNQNIGITGWSKKPLGTGVVGFTGGAGAYGGEFFGGLAEVRLRPGGEAPITLTNAHAVGELYEDATGELWLCTAAGSPGTWRQIAGPTTAGAFHAISPRRVYDSRDDTRGKLAADEERVLSMANVDGWDTERRGSLRHCRDPDVHRHRHRGDVRLRVGSPAGNAVPEHLEHQLVRARPEPGDHGRVGARRRSSDQRAGRRGTHPLRHRRRRLLPLSRRGAAGTAGTAGGGRVASAAYP